MPAKPILKLSNIDAWTGDKQIIDNFNMEIKPGEYIALKGGNGSGKSSIARFLAGYPQYMNKNGHAEYWPKKNNTDKNTSPLDLNTLDIETRVEKGLYHIDQILPNLSGINLLKLARQIPLIKNESFLSYLDLLDEALDQVGLDQKTKTKFLDKNLSGGQRKRIEVAMLLLAKPEIAILDEVDAGMDIEGQKQIASNLQAQLPKTSFIIISHNPYFLDQWPISQSITLKTPDAKS